MRLYQLNTIPAEMWGDVIKHYQLANAIRTGHFFIDYRFGGDGPLFSYLVALLSYGIGMSFQTIMITSALIGIANIVAMYLFASASFPHQKLYAYVASFLTSVSFWSITFSRQGKPYILIPFFVCLTLYFLLKKRFIWAGIVLGLGMYTQAGFWAMIVYAFYNKKTFASTLLAASFFFWNLYSQPGTFFSSDSYLGEKYLGHHHTITQIIQTLGSNILKNARSFNIAGDSTFRHNIPGHPHLDVVSGILFAAGFILLILRLYKTKDKKLLLFLFLPFFIVQVPSIIDVNNPGSLPAFGRMIGVTPFVFLYISYALVFVIQKIQDKEYKKLLIAGICGAILEINVFNYFIIYPRTLPNDNTPFGKEIAEELSSYSPSTALILYDCCWGEWGQPEAEAINFSLPPQRQAMFTHIEKNQENNICTQISNVIQHRQYVIVLPPKNPAIQQLTFCLKPRKIYTLHKNGWDIATLITSQK